MGYDFMKENVIPWEKNYRGDEVYQGLWGSKN